MLGGGSSIPLFRIAGFRIGVHPSWFLVLFLWIAVLQDSFASVLGSDSQGFTAAVLAAWTLAVRAEAPELVVPSLALAGAAFVGMMHFNS